MSLISAKREKFRIDLRRDKNQQLFEDKRKQMRDIIIHDEQFQIQQTNEYFSSKLNEESQQQKELICQYIAKNLNFITPSIDIDWKIELKIFRWIIQFPNLMQNHFMYEILLKCFTNVKTKLTFEEMDSVVNNMIQKLQFEQYFYQTIKILLRLTNQYELGLFFKVISQQKYVSTLMNFNTVETLQILSNIVCENYFDHLDVEQLTEYFIKYIDNQYVKFYLQQAIEALIIISDDKKYIQFLQKHFHLFQKDDPRMVILINFLTYYFTNLDELIHNLLEALKQTTNKIAQLKIWYFVSQYISEIIRKHQIGSTFDISVQQILWQNRKFLEDLSQDENLVEEVRNLLNQIFDNLERTQF